MIRNSIIFIFLALSLVSCSSKNMETDVIKVFNKYEQLNKEFENNNSKSNREKLEQYMYSNYAKNLDYARSLYCDKEDRNFIAKEFIDLYIKTQKNSANEIPMGTLASMYICKPDFILKEISSLEKNDKKYMTEELYLGFIDITHNKKLENQIELDNKMKVLEYYDEVTSKIKKLDL